MHHRTITTLVAVCAVLASAAAGHGQRFRDRTDVVLVEVPVQVVRDGAPVTGLSVENFELFDGKKKQKIVDFQVIDLRQMEAMDDGTGASSPAGPAVPAMARRHFLLLFDLSFSEPSSLARAQDAALDLAREGLHPTDLAAVGTYSLNRGTSLVLGFTSDRQQLELAIRSLGVPSLVERTADPLGLILGQSTAYLRDMMEATSEGRVSDIDSKEAQAAAMFDFYRAYDNAREQAVSDQRRNQITALSRSYTDLAAVMRRVNGRKQVIYFSEGFDSGLMMAQGQDEDDARATELGELWEVDTDNVFGSTRVQSDIGEMLEAFERADCVIQAVDIGGVRADSSVQAVRVADQRIDASARPDGTIGQDGLFLMANETGGELFRNFNDLSAAMARVLERTSVTYLLAFQPKDLPQDGSYHPIRIKLKDVPGAKISHRPGYFAPVPWSAQSKMEQRLANAELILGHEEGGPLRAALAAAVLEAAAGAETATVPFVVEIDGLTLLSNRLGNLLNAEIHVYALDDADGSVRGFVNQMVGLNLLKHSETLERSGIKFYGDLELPAGRYRLRALVRNVQAATYGLASTSVRVAEAGAGVGAGGAGPPALIVERPGEWLMLREDAARAYPFAAGEEVWVPDPDAEIAAGSPAVVWLETATMGGEAPSLFATVARAGGGGETEAAARLTHRQAGSVDGTERLMVSVDPAGLGAGDYVLALTLTDPVSGRSHTGQVPLRIR